MKKDAKTGKIKSAEDIEIIRECGRRLATTLEAVSRAVRPGVTTLELDTLARTIIEEAGDTPAFLHYKPDGAKVAFPATLCVSVNDQIVHGIPGDLVLKEGDVVGLDLGIKHRGYFTDSAVTVAVGKTDSDSQKLLNITKEALMAGIAKARAGARVGDIGAAIQAFADRYGYGIVRELGGHGVGYAVHELPYIPNYGEAGTGEELRPGMVLAIEPMFMLGGDGIKLAPDKFTYVTQDGSQSAHFEHTILVKEGAPEILTK